MYCFSLLELVQLVKKTMMTTIDTHKVMRFSNARK
uniref:Uncharacterized protein n=1 Tax=Arundo donax TaxID=35708 RepID=A0A0A9AGZ0_ARUDO